MIDFILPTAKNDAQAQMASALSSAGDTIQLNSGEASLFPTGYKGSATSVGDSETLNSTGIGAKVAVGDFIRNTTDGSIAWVTAVSTDSATTTNLMGGTDDTWESADEWVTGSFYAWLSKKDANGADTTRELVLVEYVDSSTDQVKIETRAVEGTATDFAADDYVSVYVSAQYPNQLAKAVGEMMNRKAEDSEVVKKEIGTTKGDVIVFTSSGTPVRLGIGSDDQILTADSGETEGVAWKTPAGGSPFPGFGTALEALTTNDFVNYYGFVEFVRATDEFIVGVSTTQREKGSITVFGNGVAFSSLKIALKKRNSRSDSLVVRIETDNGSGKPSGTLVDANATATIPNASITNTFQDFTVNFAGSFSITNYQKAHIVFSRTGTLDSTDWYTIGINDSFDFSNGVLSVYDSNSGTWADWDGAPYCSCSGLHEGGVFINGNNLNEFESSMFPAFVSADYSAGDTVDVSRQGKMTGLSGLQKGRTYVINGNSFVLRTSTSTEPAQAFALSSTEAFVDLMGGV